MATAGKGSAARRRPWWAMSYHTRLFFLLLGFSWLLVACFVVFQYHRERVYKVEKLDAQLQLFNAHLLDALRSDSLDFSAAIARQRLPMEDTRVTVIDAASGAVAFDNGLATPPPDSHLDREEVGEAIACGHGNAIRRHSRSTDATYFYSATRRGDLVVRSAVPYSVTLQEVLDADRSFLWFMLVVTLAISVLGYYATRRIGRTITRLNHFAEKAERGESVSDVGAFPHDELGSISTHIVRLYARLHATMEERDRAHRQAISEQQEKTRIKKQLTNNINHELKTPVAAITVCLETVLDHRDLPPAKHWQLLESSYAHARRLGSLLADVAAITRMDDGAAAIDKAPVRLRPLLDEIAEAVAAPLAAAAMQLTVDVPGDVVVVGNSTLLASIFRNLVDNAIAYSGGTRVAVALDGATADAYAFSVSDDGVGIAPEHRERIFERFYRIDAGRSRLAGGTGLGLSIVRNAVQLHGGTIRAVAMQPSGVRFIFTLARPK